MLSLNEKTRHLIGEKELKRMKPSAFLINMARGPVVDERALTRALSERWIQGAGLDVFEQEPTPVDNPLLKLDNVILAPHSLAWSDHMYMDEWTAILEQMNDIRRGGPEGLVNAAVWDSPAFRRKLERFRAATA